MWLMCDVAQDNYVQTVIERKQREIALKGVPSKPSAAVPISGSV